MRRTFARTTSFCWLAAALVGGATTRVTAQEKGRENLGPAVNSGSIEILPLVSPDGSTLYFDRKYTAENVGGPNDDDDIWRSTLEPDGSWSPAVNIGAPLNSEHSDVLYWISSDGRTALVNSGRKTDGRTVGLAIARREGDRWGTPRPISIAGVDGLGDSYYAHIAPDGKRLLLAYGSDSRRPDDLDIYSCAALGDDLLRWGAPVSLGRLINTPEFDGAPFMAADNRTLYFASSGHGGYGESDIWMSRRHGDGWQTWSAPVNLGPVINSVAFEASLSIPASGDYIYISGGAAGGEPTFGKSDVFRIRLPDSLRPAQVVVVRGELKGGSKGLEGLIRAERASDGREVGATVSDPSGRFTLALPGGATYRLTGGAPGYREAGTSLTIPARGADEVRAVLVLDPEEQGVATEIATVFFETGSSEIDERARQTLADAYRMLGGRLTAEPDAYLRVTGHTDDVGADEFNRRLAARRAASVRSWLANAGVGKRIEAIGRGESDPAAPNDTDEGRGRNRRVVIEIVSAAR